MPVEDDYEDDFEDDQPAPSTRMNFWAAVFACALSLWIFVLLVVIAEHIP